MLKFTEILGHPTDVLVMCNIPVNLKFCEVSYNERNTWNLFNLLKGQLSRCFYTSKTCQLTILLNW